MSDFDQGVVNATAEQTFEQIAEKLENLMDSKSKKANEYFSALLERGVRDKKFEEIIPWILKFYRFAIAIEIGVPVLSESDALLLVQKLKGA